MRKFIRIIMGVALLGAFTLLPTAAYADHDDPNGSNIPSPAAGKGAPGTEPGWHEDIPDKEVTDGAPCTVDGDVTTSHSGHDDSGAEPTFGHGHYTFIGVEIACVGIEGNLNVLADGAFDGPSDDPVTGGGYNTDHGSSTPIAWSHCEGYSGGCPEDNSNVNKGDISSSGGVTGSGWVKFIRVGPAVEAWGTIGSCTFSAELIFSPVLTPPSTHTHDYKLNGAAVVNC